MIVTFGVNPGNTPDGAVLDTLVEDAQELFGVTPEKVVGDAAYGSVDNPRKMKAKGIQLVATLKPAPNPRGKFSGDRFTFDAETQSLTCPGGKTTTDFHASPDGEGKVFRFDLVQCLGCPLRDDCTTGDFRSVKVKETIPDLQDALTYGKTTDYRQDMKDRAAIEGKHYLPRGSLPLRGLEPQTVLQTGKQADEPGLGIKKEKGVGPLTRPPPKSTLPETLNRLNDAPLLSMPPAVHNRYL